MPSWTDLLTRAESGDHVVHLYGEDDQLLARNVSRYLAEGMRRSDGLIVVATPEHTQAVARYLTQENARATLEAEREGRLLFLDARTTLAQLLVDGWPDQSRFDAVVGGALRTVRERSGSGRVRAFGEMVSLLWAEERYAEAACLEDLWNGVLAESRCSLYCAYRIDLFDETANQSGLSSILGAHSHLFAGPGTILSSGRTA